MRVLLVEPEYRRATTSRRRVLEHKSNSSEEDAKAKRLDDDEVLWYPPLGLLKLARFHHEQGDDVHFAIGCDPSLFSQATLFSKAMFWDRVYITTLFTYNFKEVIRTIQFYKDAVGGTLSRLYVGGVMASLMPDAIFEKTGIYPIVGVLHSPGQINLPGHIDIDLLPPLYELLDSRLYATNRTYYAYTTRGCPNKCKWCGVPQLEPEYVPYIDIKDIIVGMRQQYGDKPLLKLMDNNVLASPELRRIVDDLVELGYGKDNISTSVLKYSRVIDFNQGLDASLFTHDRVKQLSRLNIKPMRIAFDSVSERRNYTNAIELAHRYGFKKFSNYMLFNFKDSPRDLYERLKLNEAINEKWCSCGRDARLGEIYSYPMRYAPINDIDGQGSWKLRDRICDSGSDERDWLRNPVWTRRFVRNVEIMKGAAHGAIPPNPGLASRAVGATFEEFVSNLYMPEELLRNRNRHEKKVYKFEPKRKPGSGMIEGFRHYVLGLLRKRSAAFREFHKAVSPNSVEEAKSVLQHTTNKELKRWLRLYIRDKR